MSLVLKTISPSKSPAILINSTTVFRGIIKDCFSIFLKSTLFSVSLKLSVAAKTILSLLKSINTPANSGLVSDIATESKTVMREFLSSLAGITAKGVDFIFGIIGKSLASNPNIWVLYLSEFTFKILFLVVRETLSSTIFPIKSEIILAGTAICPTSSIFAPII